MGTNKLLPRVWLFILIVISIPVGGYFALGVKKFNQDEFWFEFVMGSIALVLVLGAIGWFVFRYFRKAKDEKAAYRGLFVYSFFLVWFAIIAVVLYPKVQEAEAQSNYLEKLESEVIHEFETTVARVEPLGSNLKSKIRLSAENLCDLIKTDKGLLEKLMNEKLPYSKELTEKHPELKEQQNLAVEFSESEVLIELLTME